jgi:hypothetical protein
MAGFGSGIDIDEKQLDQLRTKYSRPREEILAEVQANPQPGSNPAAAALSDANSRLNDITMCSQCQAQGVVKKQYGFRVIDEQCESCGGEGIIRRGQSKPASEELREKVKRVEALIAEAEDLDELERLEAALQQRSLKALNAVLKLPPNDEGQLV